MDFDDNNLDSDGREKQFFGVRLFKDQLESLEWLIVHKYHNNRNKAELIREGVDLVIDRHKNQK